MHNILSIQSHVAYGYVGNRAAVFPLQRMGCDVMAVNTVQFSNHTGYGEARGTVFDPGAIADIINGIAARGALDTCHALLSGYMGSAALGQVIVETAHRLKHANPGALYCCDPVMGDTGTGFFVADDLPPFFREHAIAAADIITPNQFELCALAGIDNIDSLTQARDACAALRAQGPEVVLLTSLVRAGTPPETIEMMVDSNEGTWLVRTPHLHLNPQPNGAGDCVAALFLGHYLQSGDAAQALGKAASAIFTLLEETHEAGSRELALIAAQDKMLAPKNTFSVKQIG